MCRCRRIESGGLGHVFELVRHAGAGAFLDRAAAWLLAREAEHNLHLSLAYARRDGGESEPEALFGTVEAAGRVVGCVIRTPPHKLLVTDMPVGAAECVASRVGELYDSIPAVLGPRSIAMAIADAWVAATGGEARLGMGQGLYRLTEVVPVKGVRGRARLATPDDIEALIPWGEGFGRDAGATFTLPADGVRKLVERHAMFVWEDERLCSMTVAQGLTGAGCRVGYVYTPTELRGSGYASALVAEVSQRMLDAGLAFCVLYTDLSNPTSNAIYQKIGYARIAEVADVDIEARSGA